MVLRLRLSSLNGFASWQLLTLTTELPQIYIRTTITQYPQNMILVPFTFGFHIGCNRCKWCYFYQWWPSPSIHQCSSRSLHWYCDRMINYGDTEARRTAWCEACHFFFFLLFQQAWRNMHMDKPLATFVPEWIKIVFSIQIKYFIDTQKVLSDLWVILKTCNFTVLLK